ncbi:hypothetical protein OPT61_g6195 [Boeremia exigua]|uniref:Uncharacterized protein n=1 Tax=Boeremia exigua TaxID=749465 RepID=A0ACC2I7I7_9PLEO|nr:hypothetical protein OPT61_g6195 [Boeremia exigua]
MGSSKLLPLLYYPRVLHHGPRSSDVLFPDLLMMASNNNGISKNTFVPKQAMAPTPALYDTLVGDGMENLAKITVSEIAHIEEGSVILDAGCGTGAGTIALLESTSSGVPVSVTGADINAASLDIYKRKAVENAWPAKAVLADVGDLAASFSDSTFSHVIGTAFIFVLPDNGASAMKEIFRVLKPGGVVALNSWFHVPTVGPLRIASQRTRPSGTPEIRGGTDQWSDPEFLKSAILRAGFSSDNIKVVQRDVYCTAAELNHYANMLWSFIGGSISDGWLQSDEENWDKAIEIIKEELSRDGGFQLLEDGKVGLKFVANIAIATKQHT